MKHLSEVKGLRGGLCDSDANCDCHLFSLECRAEYLAKAISEKPPAIKRRFGHQYSELLVAEMCGQVEIALGCAAYGSDTSRHPVARRFPEAIIDGLKTINCQNDQAQWPLIASRSSKLVTAERFETCSIR
jgi:hypothetical protein